MEIQWKDSPDTGYYSGSLVDDDGSILDQIRFHDYTCQYMQEQDRKNRRKRSCAYEVSWCAGWSMHQSFGDVDDADEQEGYGYQGTCTQTVEDIKRWCENWLAQQHIAVYRRALENLPVLKRRAEWFERNGFSLEKPEEKGGSS